MALKRGESDTLLSALALLSGVASDFKKMDVSERQAELNRKAKLEEREDRQEHEIKLMDDRQAHDLKMQDDRQDFQVEESKRVFKQQIAKDFPGVSFDADGNPEFEDYDHTQALSYKTGNAVATLQSLRQFGLNTDGTSKELNTRLAAYYQGRNKSANMMTPSIDIGVSNILGGDASPTTFTQKDIADYEAWIEGSGGYNSPIVLESLVSSGIISDNILKRDPKTGVWTVENQELIDVAMQGFKDGAIANQNFQSNMAWEANEENKRMQSAQFAQALAGSPGVVQASTVYKSTGAAIAKKLSSQLTEDGKSALLWNGQLTELSDVKKMIDKNKAVFATAADKENFKSMLDQVAQIGVDGSGIENILIQINQGEVDEGIPIFLKHLQTFDQGLAKMFLTALSQYNKITRVSDLTNRFIKAPKSVEDISDFRKVLESSGILSTIQEFRNAELTGEDTDLLQDEISNAYANMTKLLYSNKDMLNQFKAWAELEQSTADLRKLNIRGR